jgi:aryl-alcohol dehydrogenase-like predicted oxidoreductase
MRLFSHLVWIHHFDRGGCHVCNVTRPSHQPASYLQEIMNALDDVVKSGKVLYLGVIETPAWWVAAANTYARAHAKNQFVVYQGRWNVMA